MTILFFRLLNKYEPYDYLENKIVEKAKGVYIYGLEILLSRNVSDWSRVRMDYGVRMGLPYKKNRNDTRSYWLRNETKLLLYLNSQRTSDFCTRCSTYYNQRVLSLPEENTTQNFVNLVVV